MCDELKNELKEVISIVKQCLEQIDELLSILKELSTPKAGVTNCEHSNQCNQNCEHSQELINNDIIKEGINFTWDKPLSKELTDSLK